MAPSRKRSAAAANISQPAIHQVTSALESLPEKPKESLSLREAISQLQEPITVALDRGYTYDEITQLLADNGIAISVFSLKRYLSLSKSEKEDSPSTGRGRGRRRSRKTEQADEAETVTATADAPETTEIPEAAPTPEEATPRRRRKSAQAESSDQPKAAAKTKSTTRTRATTRTGATRGRKKAAG